MHIPGATIAIAAALALASSATVIEDRTQKTAHAAAESPLEALWRQPLPVSGDSMSAPGLVASDTTVVVAHPDTGLRACAATDGSLVWSVAIVSIAPPILAGETVAVATHGALRALALGTGDDVWRVELEADPSALFAFGDRIGAVVDADLLAWDAAGALVWRTKLGARPITPVAFRNGVLYAGLDEPSLVAIDAASGALRWRVPLPAQPDSLAVSDDRLYLGAADAVVYAFPVNGKADPAWRYHLLGSIGQPATNDRLVYFALLDNSLRAFDGKGGSQRWSRVLPSRPFTGPLQVGSSLAVAMTTGQVVELSPTDGRILPSTATEQPTATVGTVRLQTAAVSRDGSRVYTVTIAKDYTSTLTAWGRTGGK